VGISNDFADYYYFLQPIGRRAQVISERLLQRLLALLIREDRVLFAIDDSPTRRYGPHVQGAGMHHNPTPGPAHQPFLYGHVWVTISLVVRHPLWQTLGLPLLGLLYVRARDVDRLPPKYAWPFRTKLELAVASMLRLMKIAQNAGKTVWIVFDGAYAKRPCLKPLMDAGATMVSRLRKDAAICAPAPRLKQRGRGRPRKYGRRLSLMRKAASPRGWQVLTCHVYGHSVEKYVKTFLASYRPAGGVIRVVIIMEPLGPQFFFCTNRDATALEIIETFSDRAAIEQDFHDVKEVWGAGQQQVRVIWSSVATFNLNLWVHTLVECWAWHKPAEEIRQRDASPWDDPDRRPSHADRRNALRRKTLQNEYSTLPPAHRRSSKIRALYERLLLLAA
jgi:hypothetical protein